MMLIICSDNPHEAVDYLVEHTNKNFVFKQLLELGQLICSCGISDVYKKINQGKSIQEWIKYNPMWVLRYFTQLYTWCLLNINLKEKTKNNILNISINLHDYIEQNCVAIEIDGIKCIPLEKIENAIFRYKQGYECVYKSNSELPIDVCVEEYKKYLDWKFKKSEV